MNLFCVLSYGWSGGWVIWKWVGNKDGMEYMDKEWGYGIFFKIGVGGGGAGLEMGSWYYIIY